MKPEDIPLTGKLSENLMLSGGAAGADTYFGRLASTAGHQVIHWSFEGHKSHDPDNTVVLDDETLRKADIHLEEARLSMKRRIPYGKPHIANLFRRNWFQVQYAEMVYAVGTLKETAIISDHFIGDIYSGPRRDRMGVNGGTAWALMMASDNKITEIYLFDQDSLRWLTWKYSSQVWVSLGEEFPKTPYGIWAGIGTRKLNDAGRIAIDLLF